MALLGLGPLNGNTARPIYFIIVHIYTMFILYMFILLVSIIAWGRDC